MRRLPALHWGWLVAVAGAHAAGIAALSGLDGPSAIPHTVDARPITVSLLAPAPGDAPEKRHVQHDRHVASSAGHPPPAKPSPPAARPTAHAPAARPEPHAGRDAHAPATLPHAAPQESPAPSGPTSPQGVPAPAPGHGPEAPAPLATSDALPLAKASHGAASAAHISARYDAAYLENPAPAYPRVSRRRNEEGKVVLRVAVRADGRADKVEVATSSGHPRLDDSARETVAAWRFVPARDGETPVASTLLVPIVFRLDE